MPDTWATDLKHFLNANGSIAPPSGPARKLAEHIVAIVVELRSSYTLFTEYPQNTNQWEVHKKYFRHAYMAVSFARYKTVYPSQKPFQQIQPVLSVL